MGLKQDRNKLRTRRDQVDRLIAEKTREQRKLRRRIERKRDRKAEAETDQRKEDLADQIEALKSERAQIIDRMESLSARSGNLGVAIKRITKKIRRRRRRKKDYASKHFRYSEFDCKNGQKIPEASKPAVREWCKRVGEPARARFGSVSITSGYRPAAYNASIGGATNSVHIWDYPGRNCKAVAVDFTCASGSARDWFDFTAGKADGRGLYWSFHHADTRNNIGWPDTTWAG
jgi:hypothetical protein